MKDWIGKFIHNCIAHPAMCFLPKKLGNRFHDWTIARFWSQKYIVTWDYRTDIVSIDGQQTSAEE